MRLQMQQKKSLVPLKKKLADFGSPEVQRAQWLKFRYRALRCLADNRSGFFFTAMSANYTLLSLTSTKTKQQYLCFGISAI